MTEPQGVDEEVQQSTDIAATSDRVADLVEYLVESLIDDPDQLEIDVVDGEGATTIEVRVAQDDIGKVIGRRGRVIKSIRMLARACAARDDVVADVEILG